MDSANVVKSFLCWKDFLQFSCILTLLYICGTTYIKSCLWVWSYIKIIVPRKLGFDLVQGIFHIFPRWWCPLEILLLSVEPGLNPHSGDPFPLDLVCPSPSNIRKIFFCYRSYLSGWLLQISLRSLLEWSAWSRSSCGLKEKRKFNFVRLETSDKT